jgi:soluble lytic murein transglycosylase-like protein
VSRAARRAVALLAAAAVGLAGCQGPGSSPREPQRDAGSTTGGTSPAPGTGGSSTPGTSPAATPSTTAGRSPGTGAASGGGPAPDAVIPTAPAALAARLVRVTNRLRASVDAWAGPTGLPAGPAPRSLVLLALYQQRVYRVLARDAGLAARALALLPPRLARQSERFVAASRDLFGLVRPRPGPITLRTKPPDPPALLLRAYREAERRFGVDRRLLAAVNFVESKFGRARSASSAGAQGPMQFLPSTWAAYGLGGDVHDPHDAILGAANLLRASGAPGDDRRALFAYNHADAYVDAVLLYADAMRADPRAFLELYNWQVFVVTERGDVRLTGPGVSRAAQG